MAVDASRMPRGAKLDIRPGKTILTNGNPEEILKPFNFGAISQVTFSQAAQLQQMVQQSTGAIDSAGIPASMHPLTEKGQQRASQWVWGLSSSVISAR
jgi:hypothetical protein